MPKHDTLRDQPHTSKLTFSIDNISIDKQTDNSIYIVIYRPNKGKITKKYLVIPTYKMLNNLFRNVMLCLRNDIKLQGERAQSSYESKKAVK